MYIILGTLTCMIEEMNHEDKLLNKQYDISKVSVDEDKRTGTATIKELVSGELTNWTWDSEIDLWLKNSNNQR